MTRPVIAFAVAASLAATALPALAQSAPASWKPLPERQDQVAAQALVECARVLALMHGRFNVSVEDVRNIALAVLRHRIILNFDAHADGKTPDSILNTIISGVTAKASAA